MIPSGADLLVRCLEREGVEYVFGVPGEETLDVNDTLVDGSDGNQTAEPTARKPAQGPGLQLPDPLSSQPEERPEQKGGRSPWGT